MEEVDEADAQDLRVSVGSVGEALVVSDPAERAYIHRVLTERANAKPAGSVQFDADFPVFARLFFRKTAEDLNQICIKADLSDENEFHGLLWMLSKLSGESHRQLAVEQKVSVHQVSRWVNAQATPDKLSRRRGILSSALGIFNNSVAQCNPVPLSNTRRRARLKAEDATFD